MADYGALVSQKGYDAKTCADRFLVYSSAFQTLKIFNTYAVTGTKPASGTNTITITHNLGFYAPYIVVYNGNTTRGTSQSFFFEDGNESLLQTRNYVNSLEIDIIPVFDLGNINNGDTVYFTVYIFLDDFRTVAEQNINTGTTLGASSTDYGIRISKDGFDVKTCADTDCVLSSSFFNQIVHKKGIYSSPTGVDGEISHNLGYVPNLLHYTRNNGASYIKYFRGAYISSARLYLVSSPYDTEYYIIFKDRIN